jgi:hypothetical protein
MTEWKDSPVQKMLSPEAGDQGLDNRSLKDKQKIVATRLAELSSLV